MSEDAKGKAPRPDPAAVAGPAAVSAAADPALAPVTRRSFGGGLAALLALLASYGTAGWYAIRFLFPSHLQPRWREVYVGSSKAMAVGAGRKLTLPTGAALRLQRTRDGFTALSDTCPHLGCKVHWEPAHERFFCPCHAGAFDPEGRAIAGPPKAEGKDLARYETVLRGDGVYVRYREA